MHRLSWTTVFAVALSSSPAIAGPYTTLPLQKPTPGAADRFGFSAAAVGGFVLVGAPGENKGRGAAYLFNGRTGALVREFRRSDGQRDDQFAFSLSTDASYDVKVLSATGSPVNTVGSRAAGAGDVHLVWNGKDNQGRSVPAGTYILQVRATTSNGEAVRVVQPFALFR